MDPVMEKKIDDIFRLWQDHPGAGGQLVVVHKGQTILEKCYGYEDIEKKIPMTQESVFLVASVSKQITAFSILLLHDRGLLDVNDDVTKYIPEMKLEGPVTISHMLHHTSGLRENLELMGLAKKPGQTWRQKDLVAISARQTKLNFPSGTEFTYINSNYTLMAEIVERVSGMSFPEFTRKNIFEPLGMTHSFFRNDPEVDYENRVRGYNDDGYAYYNGDSNSCFYGSGGMRTTCRDLVKLMPEYVKPTLLSEETTRQIRLAIPPLADGTVTNYAAGVRINELLGHKYYHHGGVSAGFRAFSVIFPDDDLVIAVTTNTYNIPIETAGRDVARVILGLEPRKLRDLDEYTRDSVALEDIPGSYYRDSVSRRYDVRVEQGEVQVLCNGRWTKLEPIGGNLYKMGRRNITFAFGDRPAVNQEEAVMELRRLTAEVSPEKMNAYSGTYYSEDVDNTLTVELCDGELWVAFPSGVRQRMVCLEDEVFCCGSMAGKRHLAFLRDQTGNISGLEYRSTQIRKLIYEKQN